MYPTLIEWGWFKIHSYGFMLMVAFAVGVLFSLKRAERYGIEREHIMDVALYILIAAIVGARLMFVLLDLLNGSTAYLREPLLIFKTWRGGLSFHGGFLGGLIAGVIYCRRHGISPLVLGDVAAPGVALGYAIARIGCLLHGCCYGTPTDLPWALRFPLEGHRDQLTPPSHPTQIYSSVGGLIVCGLLLWLERWRDFPGYLFYLFIILYSVERFIVECFRKGATARVLVAGLTEAQAASLAILLVTGILFLRGRGAKKVPTATSKSPPPRQKNRRRRRKT